ncbi:MAG: hypothetical protein RR923_06390 [Bacilli bacterium]
MKKIKKFLNSGLINKLDNFYFEVAHDINHFCFEKKCSSSDYIDYEINNNSNKIHSI